MVIKAQNIPHSHLSRSLANLSLNRLTDPNPRKFLIGVIGVRLFGFLSVADDRKDGYVPGC